MNTDLLVYAAHGAFWAAFGLTRALCARLDRGTEPTAPVAEAARSAPHSRALVGVHMLAFGIMYFGIAQAVLPARVPTWFIGQRAAGALVIGSGAAIVCWTLLHFRSWRFRARLDAGHQLATGGPFAYVRNPIYLGLDLLALGTALWVPTAIVWAGFIAMAIGSDLRARAEEKLLEQAFGEPYRHYRARTRRFLPGIY